MKKVAGTLTVNPKAITITADSDKKVYDGTPLTKDSYTSTVLAEGDSIASVTVTGSQTIAGISDNVPSKALVINAVEDDVTANYEITYSNGTLEVTKKAVTITADSDSKEYDGIELSKTSYTNTALTDGDSITSVMITGGQTIVGSSANKPSVAVIKNASGIDVTASYEITYANGTLEVTKKAVTITAGSDSKEYDGTELTKDSYTNTALADGDSITSVTVTGSRTAAGKSDNVPSAARIVNAANEEVTESYEITYVNGMLEVTKKAVTIKTGSSTGENSHIYDGTALKQLLAHSRDYSRVRFTYTILYGNSDNLTISTRNTILNIIERSSPLFLSRSAIPLPPESPTPTPAESLTPPTTQLPSEPTTQLPSEPTTQLPSEPTTQLPTEPTTPMPSEPSTPIPLESPTPIPTESPTPTPTESSTPVLSVTPTSLL